MPKRPHDHGPAGEPVIPDLKHTLTTLERAESEVVAAEQELVKLLSEIRVTPRADKTSVSQIVEVALRRLRSALVSVDGAKTELAAAAAASKT